MQMCYFSGFLLLSICLRTILADSITDIILSAGYPAEVHMVNTSDFYILHMHRIPPAKPTKNVVFVMHGILSCAADFLVAGPGKSIVYMLADEGFDVWLGNARGTKPSRTHTYLNPDLSEYWDFSWHEIGKYDIPQMIDTVLSVTNQSSLQYIGHSQGTTTFFVMLSQWPKYNEKIISAHLLTPAVYFRNAGIMLRALSYQLRSFQTAASILDLHEIPSTNENTKSMFETICKDSIGDGLCLDAIHIVASVEQFNSSLLPEILKNSPASASTKQFVHFGQLVNSGDFALFDYGQEKNLKIYHKPIPPLYKLQNVNVKLQIIYGTGDFVISPSDILSLIRKFPKQIFDVVKLDGWNHLDFIYGTDAYYKVYRKIISALNQQLIQSKN